jgi:hypothetical protein
VEPGGDQAGDVRHVHDQRGPHLAGDGREAHEVDDARVGARPGDEDPRAMGARQRLDLVVVDPAVLGTHAVLDGAEQATRKGDRVAVGEVAPVGEAHAQQDVARLGDREVGRHVGGRAGVRLHVGVLGPEQPADALERRLLGLVHEIAAAVVAFARQAFRVLVVEDRALRLQHGVAREVLGGDQLERLELAPALAGDGVGDRPVRLAQARHAQRAPSEWRS